VHVVIPTHTPRHLALTLAGLARQSRQADAIVVSCDADDPAIGDVIARWSSRVPSGIWWIRRPHLDSERLCQARNNGVRHLTESLGIGTGRLVILDGDMVLHRHALSVHEDLGRSADLVLPYRINLDEPATAVLDAEGVARGSILNEPTESDARELARRDARSRKHLLMRRFHLGALHKPKLLGGHFSCDLGLYIRLNGFDEEYQGWGFKDDEFAYRAAKSGARALPACAALPAWHLWHPTRQPTGPMRDLPTARRFAMRARLPIVCIHGIRNPLPQPDVEATPFACSGPGG